jgi:TP901 family phage tail tape measure protein
MDMKTAFKEMHQMLIQGYIRSLEESGKSKSEIKATLKETLQGGAEKGPEGIPLESVIGLKAKPWLATRSKFTKEMEKLKPLGQLKELMAFLPKELIKTVAKSMDIDEVDIDREALKKATGIEQWAGSLRESVMGVRGRLGDQMEGAKLPKGVGGRVKEGKIQLASQVMQDMNEGMEALAQIESGELEMKSERAQTAIKKLSKALGFISHERVHQLGAGKGGAQVRAVAGSLAAPRGSLGKHREEIQARMVENLPNVRRLAQRKAEYEAKAEEDPTKQRRVKIGGKEERGTAAEIAQKLGGQLNTLIAEELLAYLAQGRLKDAIGDLKLGKSLEFLENRLKELSKKDKEIFAIAQVAGERMSSSTLEGLMAGVKGGAVDRGGVEGVVAHRGFGMPVAGEGALAGSRTKLGALERVLGEASQQQKFNIGALDEEALAGGKVSLTGARPLRGHRTKMEVSQVERMNELIGKAGTEETSGDEARELQATARLMRDADTETDQTGRKMYEDALRQFQAARASFLINQARELESELDSLIASGQGEGQKARDLGPMLQKKVEEIRLFFRKTTQNIATPNLAQIPGMGPTPAALEAGILDPAKMFEGGIKSRRGKKGSLEAKKFEKTEEVLWGMHAAIEKNVGASKQLAVIWEHAKNAPKDAVGQLEKAAQVTKLWSQTFRQLGLPDQADAMARLSKDTQKMGTAMGTMAQPSKEAMLARLPKALKQQIYGQGPGEAGLAMPVTEQYAEFEARTKAHQKKLQTLTESGQFKKLGAGTDFEPMKTQIIDPETNQVIQNMEAQFTKSGKRIQVNMKQTGVAAQRMGRRIKDTFRRVVQWGFATGIVYGTMRAFRALSTTLTDVQDRVFALKKVMDVTITDFGKLQDSAVGMAKNYGIAINEVLDGMVVYGQQGLKVNEIMERTKATLLAVNVTTLDSKGATEALTAAHKVFGGEISNSMGFVDAWAKVAAKHAITAKDLADVVKKAGAAAGIAGMNFQDFMGITTAIGVVSRQTGKEIGTSLKFMMRGMRRPVAQKEFAGLGISSLTKTGELRPAMDILTELANKWHDLSRAQQLAAAQAAAGIRHYNSFIILMNNFDEALEASAHAAGSQGFAFRKNALAMETLSKQMSVLRESVKGLGLELGKTIVPTVTAATKALSVLVDLVSKIPGPMLQIGTLGLAGMLAFHKAADMVVDSLDAMMGYGNEGPRLKKFFGKEGYIGGMGKGLKKSFKGIFGGLGTMAGMGMSKLIDVSGPKAKRSIFDPKQQGLIVRGLDGMRLGVIRLATSLGFLGSVAGLAAVALAGLAVWQLVKFYKEATKTGQEVADQMFDQIGKSQDLADSYRSQSTELRRVSLSQKKLASAQRLSADVPATQKALIAGEYKGAALAARELESVMAGVGKAVAKIDPTSIITISESGKFIYDVSEGFQALADSAVDAQNAITMSMQTDVMKAFAEDIVEAQGLLDNWSQAWNDLLGIGGDLDFSLAGKMEESKKAIQDIATERQRLVEAGFDTLSMEEMQIHALEYHLSLQEKIGVSAIKLKEVLDQMPTFENLQTLAKLMGPKFMEQLRTGAASGQFGEGATGGSIAFDILTKSAGIGELTESYTAANPAYMLESLLEKGVKPEVFSGAGMGAGALLPKATGEIMTVSRDIAEALLKETTAGFESFQPDAVSAAVTAMQSMISNVDTESGKMVWVWYNALSDSMSTVSALMVGDVISTVSNAESKIALFRQKAIEAAALATKRLLTMQFTGVMAGIRDPGGFNIGAGTRRELTAEQRVMESLPLTLQRMVDLQKEMTEINRQYNEQLGEGNVQEASAQMAKTAGAVKVMDDDLKELVMTLQREGFEISKALHYNMAIQNLNKTLEEAALVAKEAASAEERRTQFVKHLSGALAGMPELPSLTFGKGKKDLTGLERLQSRMPGLAKIVKGFDQLLKKRDTMLGVLTDIDKKKASFVRSMDELIASGERLSDEQLATRSRQLAKGMTEGEIGIIKVLKDTASEQSDYMKSQTDILSSILKVLSLPLEMEGMSDEKRTKAITSALNEASTAQIETMMRELPGRSRRAALFSATGIGLIPPERRKDDEVFEIKSIDLGLEGDALKEFNKLVKRLVATKKEILEENKAGVGGLSGRLAGPGGTGAGRASVLEELYAQEQDITHQLLKIEQVREQFKKEARKQLDTYIGAARSDRVLAELSKSHRRIRAASVEAAKQALLASGFINAAESELVVQLMGVNKSLQAAKSLRLAAEAENFAKSLEDIIDDFKKTEALALDPKRVKSDLEGPFARVGKPGFKTDFETREEEARKKLTSGDAEERKSAQEELVQIEFDVKNAKLKQQQDKEVQELKRQQSQAEKFRETLYQALQSGEYAGEEIEGRIKGFFHTLTSELETAEQATMSGGELYFEGVPSLQNVGSLVAELKSYAEKKAKSAEYKIFKKAFEDGGMKDVKDNTDHLRSLAMESNVDLKSQTTALQEILTIMRGTDLSATMAEAFGALVKELGRVREEQRKEMESLPGSAAATLPKIAQNLSKIQGMENLGTITSGNADKRKALAAAGAGGSLAMAAALARPVDELVTSIYKFSDTMHAVVTEVGGPGGRVVGSQTFEIKKGIIQMGGDALVDPSLQRRGIGQGQLAEVMRFSKQQGLGGLEASRGQLGMEQAMAYRRAGQTTGAEVRLADPKTEISRIKSPVHGRQVFEPRTGFDGPILRVLTDNVAEGTKIGILDAAKEQNFLQMLKERQITVLTAEAHRGPQGLASGQLEARANVEMARKMDIDAGAPDRAAIRAARAARPELAAAPDEYVDELAGMMDQSDAVQGGRLKETPAERLEGARTSVQRELMQEAADEESFNKLRGRDAVTRRSRHAPPPGTGPLPEPRGRRAALRRKAQLEQTDADFQWGEPKVKTGSPGSIKKFARSASKFLGFLGIFAESVEGTINVLETGKAIEALDEERIKEKAGDVGRQGGYATAIGGAALTGAVVGGPVLAAILGLTMAVVLAGDAFAGQNKAGQAFSKAGQAIDEKTSHGLTSLVATLGDPFEGARERLGVEGPAANLMPPGYNEILSLLEKIAPSKWNQSLEKVYDTAAKGVGHEDDGSVGAWLRDVDINPADEGSFFPNMWNKMFGKDKVDPSTLPEDGLHAGADAGDPPISLEAKKPKDWLKQIEAMQGATFTPGAVDPVTPLGPAFPLVGGDLASANAQGGWHIPDTFKPGPPLPGSRPPQVQTGTARTDYTSDGSFPSAQTFKLAPRDLGPGRDPVDFTGGIDEATAYRNAIRAAAQPGMRVFEPDRSASGDAFRDRIAGGDSWAAQEMGERLQAERRQRAAAAALTARNIAARAAVPSVSPTQSDAITEIVEKEDAATPAAAPSGETTRAVAEALEEVGVQLKALKTSGLKLPPEFTAAMTASNTAIITKLGDVGVSSLPTDITVGLTEGAVASLAAAAGKTTSESTAGAQQLAESIGELKSELLGEDGLVKQKVTESVEDFEKRMTQVENETSDLENRITISTESITSITNETLPTITASINQEKDKAEKTKLKIDETVNRTIPEIRKKLDSVQKETLRALRQSTGAKKP